MNRIITRPEDSIIAKLADATRTDEGCIRDMIRAEKRRIGCLNYPPDSLGVASRMLEWFEHASGELDAIQHHGLARWTAGHSFAKVWATLAGLKEIGRRTISL